MIFKKPFILLLQKLDYGSSLSMRLVKITGKANDRIHPKHLIDYPIWFKKYINKDDVFLDLGCGVATNTIRISATVKSAVCLDSDSNTLKIAEREAKKRGIKNIEFLFHDANYKLPFASNSFNKVLVSDVLEHLNKRDYAISEIKRVLKKGGKLLLVVDNPDTSWKKLQKSVGLFYYADSDHKYEYPKKEILNKLEKSGFKVEDVRPVTYDSPLVGLLDLTGGISLSLYKFLRGIRENFARKYPNETTGYRIVASKIR